MKGVEIFALVEHPAKKKTTVLTDVSVRVD